MPWVKTTKLLVKWAVAQLEATFAALAVLKHEIFAFAAQLPEYPVIMGYVWRRANAWPAAHSQIGDVRRFCSKKAVVACAGIAVLPNDLGDATGRHKSMSKPGYRLCVRHCK